MTSNPPSIVKPAAIGGAIFGFLAALPYVGAINCACCALIIGGGLSAAYFHANALKVAGLPMNAGLGAKVGALSGVFYTIVSGIVGGVLGVLRGGPDFDEVMDQLNSQPDVPPFIYDFVEFLQGLGMGGLLLLGSAVSLVLGLIFGTIGGLIGGKVFQSEPPKPAAPAAPPAPPAPPAP